MSLIDELETLRPSPEELAIDQDISANWVRLSEHIGQIKSQFILTRMIKSEMLGRKRPQILLRIHSRLCTVRRNDEQRAILQMVNE